MNIEKKETEVYSDEELQNKYRFQERWSARNDIISKSYKLKRSVVDVFFEACKAEGKSQASVLTELMTDYADKVLK